MTVNYVGVLYKTGKEFDSSWKRNEPFSFTIGKGEVIPGWEQGVVGMKVGGRRELIIPPSAGVWRKRLATHDPGERNARVRGRPARRIARAAPRVCGAVALGLAAGAVAAGCGSGTTTTATTATSPSPARVQLATQDTVAAARAIGREEPAVKREVEAARAAWPLIYAGFPVHLSAHSRHLIERASAAAAAIRAPERVPGAATFPLLEPAASAYNPFRAFALLASRSWAQLAATARLQTAGPPLSARFAREASGLYIGAVYDAHAKLSGVGKRIENAFHELGGPNEFAGPLTEAEVEDLATAYSEASAKLVPAVSPQLGM